MTTISTSIEPNTATIANQTNVGMTGIKVGEVTSGPVCVVDVTVGDGGGVVMGFAEGETVIEPSDRSIVWVLLQSLASLKKKFFEEYPVCANGQCSRNNTQSIIEL